MNSSVFIFIFMRKIEKEGPRKVFVAECDGFFNKFSWMFIFYNCVLQQNVYFDVYW